MDAAAGAQGAPNGAVDGAPASKRPREEAARSPDLVEPPEKRFRSEDAAVEAAAGETAPMQNGGTKGPAPPRTANLHAVGSADGSKPEGAAPLAVDPLRAAGG